MAGSPTKPSPMLAIVIPSWVAAIASISLIAYRQVRRRRSATTESGQTPTGTASG